MTPAAPISVARVYEPRRRDPSQRVLVDRLWPRGLRRDDPRLDEWLPGAAPSASLRRWYGHRPEAFPEFAERYRLELAARSTAAAVQRLLELARNGNLVLLTATRDLELSGAEVLRGHLNLTLNS